jgi:Uma2 family endonuclease
MNTALKDFGFDVEDYLADRSEDRYELIGGQVFMMAPPTVEHQRTVQKVFKQLDAFFTGKSCEAFVSPIGVCLNENTAVQPDVLVVCDRSKIGEKTINGAPDLVVEVSSPSTKVHDLNRKRLLYKEAGVREYWVVDDGRILKFTFEQNEDEAEIFGGEIQSTVFPGLKVVLNV